MPDCTKIFLTMIVIDSGDEVGLPDHIKKTLIKKYAGIEIVMRTGIFSVGSVKYTKQIKTKISKMTRNVFET